jgi:hypothetical protein
VYRRGLIKAIESEIAALQMCRSEYEEKYIKSHLYRLIRECLRVNIVLDYKALVPTRGWHPRLTLIK